MKTLAFALSVTLAAALPAWADLRSAAYRGDAAETRRFIAEKADLEVRDQNGWTPLMTAVYWEQFEVANLLLAAGADPNARATRAYSRRVVAGATPLILCGIYGYPDMAARLLQAGADPSLRDLHDRTVRDHAAKRRFGAILDLLPLDACAPDPSASLLEAVLSRHALGVKACIDRKADPDARDGNGWTPLMHAAVLGDERIAALLLEAGADPNLYATKDSGSRLKRGMTPLILCGYYGHPAMAALLLKAKADPNQNDSTGSVASTYAARFNYREVLEVLDPAAALAEAPRASSLLEAARNRDHPALERLLAEKADPDVSDRRGWTPLMHAVHQKDEKAVILLLGAGANPNLRAFRKGVVNECEGTTALILCGYYGTPDLAARLLKAGADPSVADADGHTAAYYAGRFCFTEVLALLEGPTPPSAPPRNEP